MCKCTPQDTKRIPQPEQESIFRTVFAGRVRFGDIFRRSLKATTKKRSSTFLVKKCTPRQNPGYAYGVHMYFTLICCSQVYDVEREYVSSITMLMLNDDEWQWHASKFKVTIFVFYSHSVESYFQLEMRSVERGICPIATSIMNDLFQ